MLANFRPSTSLTICSFLGLAVLFYLGTWQALKIGPKTQRNAAVEAGFSQPPMDVPTVFDDPLAYEFRHVSFVGDVMDVSPIRHFLSNLKGKPGYQLYLPVKLDAGLNAMVNMGWIPFDHDLSTVQLPKGKTRLTGFLRQSAITTSFQPPNDLKANVWYVANVDDMTGYYDLPKDKAYPLRIILDDKQQAKSLPLKGQMHVTVSNKHREYAFTWFGIAAGLIAVYIGFGVQRGREMKPQASNKSTE